MTAFTLHDTTTAPEASRAKLAEIEKGWGFIPNLHRTLAESSETLEAYNRLFEAFNRSSFTPVERHVAYLAIIYVNECEYCMAGHSVLAKMAKVPAAVIDALRENRPLDDPRLEALRRFAAAVTAKRGFVGDKAVDAFIEAGFTKQNVLEVVLAVATKTISNYTNHLTHTPNDVFMKDTAWTAPSRRAAVAVAVAVAA